MVINHRKKSSRHRGSWTHGTGEKKKHRGAGSRGGRGNAGSGKRGDAKKPSYWKNKNFDGKHGFTNPNPKIVTAATIAQLNVNIKRLVQAELATFEKDVYSIDLSVLGVDKLIATGTPEFAMNIIVPSASAATIAKIEAAGGKVIVDSE